jgi:transcriptional regulator with XRE-family HTH domain
MDNAKTGALIARIRMEKNLTQKELADRIGVTNATISKWETGKGFPDISLLEPLANSLDISITEIIVGEKSAAENDPDVLIRDLVDASVKEQQRKTRLYNWVIAITVAIVYIVVSLLTLKWEYTWLIWFAYCFYRIATEFVFTRRR